MIPTSLAQLLELIRANGDVVYAFLFSYAAANSLLGVLFAGYAAALGALDWTKVFLVCWAGGVVGDAVRFWIGRKFGRRLLKARPGLERLTTTIVRLVENHLVLMMMLHRYPHGTRSIAGFACGIANVPAGLFLALNVVSAGVWAALVSAAGYGFGQLSEKVLTDAASGVGLVGLLLFLGIFWLLSKKLERAIETKP